MYRLTITTHAENDLRRISSPIQARILNKLQQLREICNDFPHKALKGIHRGKYSLKAAKDYRIIYTLDRSTREITVHRIGHRSNIY